MNYEVINYVRQHIYHIVQCITERHNVSSIYVSQGNP